MRSRAYLGAVLVLGAVLALGCGDDGGGLQPDLGVDQGPPVQASVSFDKLTAGTAVKGTQSVTTKASTGVTKVELLQKDTTTKKETVLATSTTAPFTISWDTTKTKDGLVTLKLKAYAGTSTGTSAEIAVIVLNVGQEMTLTEGATATMSISSTSTETHIKHHWVMPSNMKKVVSLVFWKNALFKMRNDIGIGQCPDHGQKAATVSSDTSPVITTWEDANGLVSGNQWFTHAAATNETVLDGKSTEITFKVYLFP